MLTSFDPLKLRPGPRGSVVSIGVFDGVHLGHQAILAANLRLARAHELVPTVVTFRRHPRKVLSGSAPRELTTLEHRLELFGRAEIEHVLVLNFDEQLRELSAEDFLERILRRALGARRCALGADSRYGRDRRGSPAALVQAGLPVEIVPAVEVGGAVVSSTAIRAAVERGELERAAAMLGRPVSVFGQVVHGDARGRELGFPTANLDLHHELHPPLGVYACRARRAGAGGGREPGSALSAALPAVANIGVRPTVAGEADARPVVEVHLLDFDGQLYGERLELEFVARLREERRFPDLGALRAQIERDVAAARALLAAGALPPAS